MSFLQDRGGKPICFRGTVDTTGRAHRLGYPASDERQSGPHTSMWLRIRTTGDALEIYFNETDFNNDEHFVLLAAGEILEGPVGAQTIWFKAATASATLELLSLARL